MEHVIRVRWHENHECEATLTASHVLDLVNDNSAPPVRSDATAAELAEAMQGVTNLMDLLGVEVEPDTWDVDRHLGEVAVVTRSTHP